MSNSSDVQNMIDTILELDKEASRGPWKDLSDSIEEQLDEDKHFHCNQILIEAHGEMDWMKRLVIGMLYHDGPVLACRPEDIALIVYYRTAMPILVRKFQQLLVVAKAAQKYIQAEDKSMATFETDPFEERLEKATEAKDAEDALRELLPKELL
jgi:hypothetical protein